MPESKNKNLPFVFAFNFLVFLFLFLCQTNPCLAREEVKEWEKKLSDQNRQLLHEARQFRYLNVKDGAVDQYETLIRQEPRNPFIIKEAAEAFASKGEFVEAQALFNKALFLRPFDPDFRLAWARALQDNGKADKAIEELRVLLNKNPGFIEARKELALYLGWQEKWGEALQEYEKVLAIKPDDKDSLRQKAQLLNWSQQFDEAIPLYEQLVKENPDDADAWKDLAFLYSWTGKHKQAASAFERLLYLRPDDPVIMKELGDAYFYDQKYGAAQQVYSNLSESNPGLARKVSGRMGDISIMLAPTVTFSYLFYWEKSRIEYNQSRSTSHYYTWEVIYPFSAGFKWISTFMMRNDNTINTTSQMFGQGFQVELFRNFWYETRLTWEPRNFDLNPRWGYKNLFTWKVAPRVSLSAYNQYTTYWDTNRSNSSGFGATWSLLKNHDLVLGYRFTYDVAEQPSSYFVSIKDREGDWLDLITNTFSVEKYWTLYKGAILTTGSSFDITTDGRNTYTAYTSISFKVTKRTNWVFSYSWGRDTRRTDYISASGYFSFRF